MDEAIIPPSLTTVEPTPELPLAPVKKTSPVIPLLFGVVMVVIITSVLAGIYYFSRLKSEIKNAGNPTPTPQPSIYVAPSPTPDSSLTPASSSGVKASSPNPKASVKPKPSPTPTTKATPTPTPTPAPVSLPTLDIRYANPSAHVKQTYDDGSGDGRVINREFSSIQIGEFDELKTSWHPKVTVCFHIVSNSDLSGSDLKYTLTEDDKVVSDGTLSQYQKIEAGKTYDLCHDTTNAIGPHTLRLNINQNKSFAEANYSNNLARLDFKNLADNIAPNFTLAGPYDWTETAKGTCFLINHPSDNVTEIPNLKFEHKIDASVWAVYTQAQYCFTGNSGETHSYAVRATDARGNQNEQSSTFNLY